METIEEEKSGEEDNNKMDNMVDPYYEL